MKLYYHKTDGGAEYLCSAPVKGTEEGDVKSPIVIRIDENIQKDAELVSFPPGIGEPEPARSTDMTRNIQMAVIVSGGLVQHIESDSPALIGVNYVIIDMDTDDVDDDEVETITENGTTIRAHIQKDEIKPPSLTIYPKRGYNYREK